MKVKQLCFVVEQNRFDFKTVPYVITVSGFCCLFAVPEEVTYSLNVFHQTAQCVPAVEFLGMLLPHCVKPVGNGGILSKQHNDPIDQNSQLNTSSCVKCFWETHNANREVVVDDFVWHRVAFFLILICDDLHTPAIHQHLRAPLDVLENTTQILSIVSFKKATHTKTNMTRCLQVHKFRIKHWQSFSFAEAHSNKHTHSKRAHAAKCFNCKETLQVSFISHLLPIADIAQGHFLCPEEVPRQVAVPTDWLCLMARKGKKDVRQNGFHQKLVVLKLTHAFNNARSQKSHLSRLESSQLFRLPRTPGSCSPADFWRNSIWKKDDGNYNSRAWHRA